MYDEVEQEWEIPTNSSVFTLIGRLCEKISEEAGGRSSVKRLRSEAFRILLSQSGKRESSEPAIELLDAYFRRNLRRRTVADYRDVARLKCVVEKIVDERDVLDRFPHFREALVCIALLENCVPDDGGRFVFENPFTFGKLDEAVPSIAIVDEGSPRPYTHFPSEIFRSPFPIDDDPDNDSGLYPYSVKRFLYEPGTGLERLNKFRTIETGSNFSHDGERSSSITVYTENSSSIENFPKLIAPRDLKIPQDDQRSPKDDTNQNSSDSARKISTEVHHSEPTFWNSISRNANFKLDLWKEASKMPPVEKRGFVSSSLMRMSHWKKVYADKMDRLHVVSEAQFILHVKYLTIGISSSSFYFDKNKMKFTMKPDLCMEGLHRRTLQIYAADLIKTGTCYWRLNASVATSGRIEIKEGFVYKSMRDSIRQYLVWFRLEIDKVFGEGLVTIEREGKRLPSLLEVVDRLKPLSMQIQTMAKVYKACERDRDDNRIRGSELMAYLYNEIMMITWFPISGVFYAMLQAACQVYFRFIQRFIFEGELEDRFDEFFIRKDNRYINSFNKQYWNKGFVIRENETVPEFLRGMARYILLCGKSLRLLKLCNPDDPFCIMLSTDYPSIECCLTFEKIEERQKLYDQYRTQCLYVCGEPITFQSLLFQKEAEKRAFREMVFMKQAETMEKLIDERKRLSRMLMATKRKQFAALREAAEDAVAQRNREREKIFREEKLIIEQIKAADKLHSLKVEEEKKRVIAFYSEIEKEVNRRKLIAEWKIKRLQLDVRRVQLLTSEKANYSRESLELKYKSTENKDKISDDILRIHCDNKSLVEEENIPIIVEEPDIENINFVENSMIDSCELDDAFSNDSLKQKETLNIDLQNENIISISQQPQFSPNNNSNPSDINSNISSNLEKPLTTYMEYSPSDILNSNILLIDDKNKKDEKNQILQESYQNQRLEALRNKNKVLSHEFGDNVDQSGDSNEHILSVINNNISEARQNRIKMLSSNFDSENNVINKYDPDVPMYNTEASREALRNKQRILGHEFGIDMGPKVLQLKRRENLTLDLENCSKPVQARDGWTSNLPLGNTPGSYVNTPNDFNGRLDIETPSTFDVVPFGLPSAASLSPTSAQVIETNEDVNVTKMGFRFPNVIEENNSDEETLSDYQCAIDELDGENEENNEDVYNVKSTVWSFCNDDLNFKDFKPFIIDSTVEEKFTTLDIFDRKINMDNIKSPYPNIIDIIKHAEKSPTSDIFNLTTSFTNKDLLQKVDDTDLSTISTCLQRSIMIPLFYQMELVNNATLKYFLVNCDLYDHLKNICDYFFLMDGEFAKTICTNIFEKLNTVGSPKELLNFATLHSILDKSFGSSVSGVNKYAENLSFIVSDMPNGFHHSSPDVLECLTLSYTVSWPLNIIFSQEAMDRYTKVFQFLLKLRRISWALEHDSEILKMSLKEEFMVSKELLRSPQYHSVQLYRYMMSSLIRSLHSYISATCLQSSWKEFEKDLISARTLDDLYCIHVIYVKKVLFRCLLNNRSSSVMKLLNGIFSVILQFHHHLNARCWHIAENEIYYTHPLFSKLWESFNVFDKLSKHLYKMVTRLTECGYQPHLAELLSVLNMNDYYNTSKK